MSIFSQDDLLVDGQPFDAGMHPDELLVRAVVISLFTWRRANPGDVPDGQNKFGWWGDTYAADLGDKIGSRLWLLAREKIADATIQRAREYAAEALQWLIDDGVATRIDVTAARAGLSQITVSSKIYRSNGAPLDLRFSDIWRFLSNAV